ncbi:MAG: HAMP domain-containing sensor histidine kinase [Lachnospiraceae bacterium]|nr:HAMP domain-containing sensor histidine kinase [Lachnospiraceae bacterium]
MTAFYMIPGCVLLCAAICITIFLYERNKSKKILERVLQELDDAITGNLLVTAYDESLDDAIRDRLNRVVQISGMQRDEAQKERDAVKSLISDISHQVRTPLSNILLYSELLEETLQSSCAHISPAAKDLSAAGQMAAKIRQQSEKLDFFIRELTRSSYAEQEMISITPQQVSAKELIDKACQGAELAALKKGIRILRQNTDYADCICFADPKWTVEALENILENAVKYSPEASDIAITAASYESFVCVEIKDYGIGISEAEQGAIFRRFYRSPQVSETPGFGIGLYLVREVLSRQGGYVKVQSSPGAGSAFQVFLSKLSPLRKI